MMAQRLAALCALAASASVAQDLVTEIESGWFLGASGVFSVYLGTGRQATVSDVASTIVPNCLGGALPELEVRVKYAPKAMGSSGVCIPVRRGSEECVWVTNTTDPAGDFVRGPVVVAGVTSPFVAAGGDVFEFFGEYAVNVPVCVPGPSGSTVSLSWTASVTNPADGFCVQPQDSQVISGDDAPAIDYFATDAELPRHSSRKFVAETRYVPGLNTIAVPPTFCFARPACVDTSGCAANEVCLNGCCKTGSQMVYDLGLGPQMDISCLNVFSSPAVVSAPAGCTPSTDAYALTLVDAVDCNEFSHMLTPPYNGCCPIKSAEECDNFEASATATNRVCMWAAGRCHPTISMHTVDLKTDAVLTDKQSVFSFSSSSMNGPRSEYVQLDDHVFDPSNDNVGNRRWFLKYTLLDLPTDPSTGACDKFVTLSFKSTTTGGLCEPSSRSFCDGQAETCMRTNPLEYPRYWRWSENAAEVRSDYLDDEYKTCNCLKQKEICYRKNGCVSTKRYQLILMNCLDQGCGNWCTP
ncbi:hypothetical protein DIPPA_30884 [Diplonema papillatum]|nr:hypothetical protein DIPPA_30884 [Diplonema papillatum]